MCYFQSSIVGEKTQLNGTCSWVANIFISKLVYATQFVLCLPLIAQYSKSEIMAKHLNNQKIETPPSKCVYLLITKSFQFVFRSASSGNSAELTTIKNLKRSKNKGRKKKAKTKQSQTQQQTNKTTEPDQEAKPQEATSAKSATPTLEQQTSLATETVKPEEVAADSENKLNRIVESIADKQATGKYLHDLSPYRALCVWEWFQFAI